MASPFRSSSPVTDRRKPVSLSCGFTSQTPTNGTTLRKGFSINVAPKAPPGISKNNNTVTPANSPADYPHRGSPFMEPNPSPRPFEDIKENAGETARCSAKSFSGRSPTLPKGMKSFMAPTFSAASKATSPRKRILSERNEVATAALQSPVKNSISSPIAGLKFPAMEIAHCVRSMSIQDSLDLTKETSIDYMEVDQVQPGSESESKLHKISEAEVVSDFGTESSSFLAGFPDPGEDVVNPSFPQCQGSPEDVGFIEEQHSSSLPPYDPKRNYLSPRPQFLRYRPNRGLQDIFPTDNGGNAEEEEGFGDHDLDKHEFTTEDGIKETKEIRSLEFSAEREIKETEEMRFQEQPMAAVDVSTEMRQGEIQEEVDAGKPSDEETASVESSVVEEKLCNLNIRQFESKVVEGEEDGASDDDEELKKPSGWIKRSVLFVCLLASVSICVMAYGSPGLVPSPLQNNALAVKGIESFSRNDVVEGWTLKDSRMVMEIAKLDFLLKDVSRYKFGVIVNNMKARLDSCASKFEMLRKSAMDELTKNSFTELHTNDMEQTSVPLGLLTDVEQDINGHILFPELIKSSVEGKDSQTLEKHDQSDEENGTPVSEYPSQQPARIIDADERHWQETREPLSSELQEEDIMLVVDEPEIVACSNETLQEVHSEVKWGINEHSFEAEDQAEVSRTFLVPEATQSINEKISGARNHSTSEDSETILVPEATQSNNDNASEAEHQPGVSETILVSNSEEMSVLMDAGDSQINEAPISLPLPKGNAGFEMFEGDCETIGMEKTTFDTRSIEGDASYVFQQEINSGSVSSNELEATEVTEPVTSYIKGDVSHVSQQKINSGSVASNELEAKEVTDPVISCIDEDTAAEPASPATEDMKGSEDRIPTIPRRSGRERLLIGASVGASILAAVAIAVVYFASATKKYRKGSEEVKRKSDPKEEVKPKRDSKAKTDYFSPTVTAEKTHSRMQSPYSRRQKEHLVHPRTSPARIGLLGEYVPPQMSTSDKNASGTSHRLDTLQAYERRSHRRSSMSSASQQEYTPSQQDYTFTSDFSADSPSYGSFTTYEKFVKKESTEDEEQKVLRLTPVRRSSRIRKQAMSP